HPVRFIAIPIEPVEKGGTIATAFDSCLICGPRGYYQDGPNVACLHCASAIYPPSIGQPGGCNPIPLKSRTEGGDLVLAAADLATGVHIFKTPAAALISHCALRCTPACSWNRCAAAPAASCWRSPPWPWGP